MDGNDEVADSIDLRFCLPKLVPQLLQFRLGVEVRPVSNVVGETIDAPRVVHADSRRTALHVQVTHLKVVDENNLNGQLGHHFVGDRAVGDQEVDFVRR